MIENNSENKNLDYAARIEAILFVASMPVTAAQIAETLEIPVKTCENVLNQLRIDFAGKRGTSIQVHGGKYQITTTPEYAEDIEKFLGLESTSKLSRAALETMAIVAYRQPITRPGIDAIRGVSSDGVIKSLLSKGLIQEVGRAEGPGRPILFSITTDFLQHFGLNSIDELPLFESEPAADEEKKNGILKD